LPLPSFYSQQYLLEVGKWLKKFGDAIYGTTYGIIAAQPWGVTTSKPGLLFLHVMQRPANGKLLVPGFNATITKVYQVDNKKDVKWEKSGTDLIVSIPELEDKRNTVFAVNYSGKLTGQSDSLRAQIVSQQYDVNELEAINGTLSGNGKVETITYSYYFGDWKHTTCITGLADTSDAATFKLRITEPGDFKVVLEYTCPDSSKNQEGIVEFNANDQQLYFHTLHTSEENSSEPVLFIKHAIGIVHVDKPGQYSLKIHPYKNGGVSLFKMKDILLVPVK
jgi:alpha-L-fucosidase